MICFPALSGNRSLLVAHRSVVFTPCISRFPISPSQSLEVLLRPTLSAVCVHDVVLPALQQAVVGLDLLLQAALDIQQGLVLLVLALHLCPYFGQPLLHAGDLALELSKVFVVAAFGFCQGGLQIFFLRMETGKRNPGTLQA